MDKYFSLIMLLVLGLNGLWYLNKIILKRNGFPINWFSNHFRDISNMWKLAKKTDNPFKKNQFYLLAISLPAGSLIFMISFFVLGSKLTMWNPCEYESYFRQTEWSGIVVKKYRDASNHNYETIEIKNQNGINEIQDWNFFSNGNYTTIEVGDSISKVYGETNVKLYKDEYEITLKVDFDCEE